MEDSFFSGGAKRWPFQICRYGDYIHTVAGNGGEYNLEPPQDESGRSGNAIWTNGSALRETSELNASNANRYR